MSFESVIFRRSIRLVILLFSVLLFLAGPFLDRRSPSLPLASTQLPMCVGILAYQGKRTLEDSLRSFEEGGLMRLARVMMIHFQKVDSPSRLKWSTGVLRKYPKLRGSSTEQNIEFRAFLMMAQSCEEPYFLTIEEDFRILPSNYHLVTIQLSSALDVIESGVSDAVLLRSRDVPGKPDYARESFAQGSLGSQWLLEHAAWNYHAEDDFEEITACRVSPKYWCTSTRHASFTNNPVLYKTNFYSGLLENSSSLRYADIEPTITKLWRTRNLTVSRSLGIFTHERVDRSVV